MCIQNVVYFNVLYKFASMIRWLVDQKALMMQFIVCKTEKANFTEKHQ